MSGDLEQLALERLRAASEMSLRLYKQPLVITYSGGKDSDVLLRLAQASGIPFEVQHSHTSADAPETVYHVRNTFRRLEEQGIQCTIDYHKRPGGGVATMWNLIPKNGIPTRLMRFCCNILKETSGKDRFIATGVRWEESPKRKTRGALEVVTRDKSKKLILSNDNDEDRRLFETCQLKGKRVVNPIIDWTTADVLDYAVAEKIPMNPLYGCGFGRVGCVGCPLASYNIRKREFVMWPKYKAAYIRAFDRMLEARRAAGREPPWQTGVDVYHWWLADGVLPGQEVIDGFEEV